MVLSWQSNGIHFRQDEAVVTRRSAGGRARWAPRTSRLARPPH